MDRILRHAADFDRIALLPDDGFDHNSCYHDFLMRQLGARMDHVLDLGCGTGRFSRLLAERANLVTGIDVSANMIEAARRQSAGSARMRFVHADALQWDWPDEQFEAIVSIATLHHLPLGEILPKIKSALRPGGVFAMLDLRRCGLLGSTVPAPYAMLLRLIHTGRFREDAETRRLWAEHGKTDRYLTIGEVRRICAPILPEARIRRHLLWRYSMVWRKPAY
jgi:SAM-dependent methyltransferase